MNLFKEFFKLLFSGEGNKSSLYATFGNTALAIAKGVVAFTILNGASASLTAEFYHSLNDTFMQLVVFLGSVMAMLPATKKFPNGFKSAVNLFCVIAVVFGGIMSFTTIKHGIEGIINPHEVMISGLYIAGTVLLVSILVEGFVLFHVSHEVVREAELEHVKGFKVFFIAFKNLKTAAPATKLVYLEDTVAVVGASLAFLNVVVAVLVSEFAKEYLHIMSYTDAIISTIIGGLMMFVIVRLGVDNAAGLLGVAAPKNVEDEIEDIIYNAHESVKDLNIRVIKMGDYLKVEGMVEIKKGMDLEETDDIIHLIKQKVMEVEPDVQSIILEHKEDDGIQDYIPEQAPTPKTT